MRILYVVNSSNPGGVEQHVLDLVNQMILRGHEVFVWCGGGIIYDWYKKAGARVVERPIKRDIDFAYIKDLAKFLRLNNIDVAHSHELKAVTNTLIACFLARTKVRITHQHTPFSCWQVSKFKKIIYNYFYSLLVNALSSREIALTGFVKNQKLKSGVRNKKLVVIPNGIDTYKLFVSLKEKEIYKKEIRKRYLIDKESVIFGNVGRTTVEKGHSILIEAFAKFLNECDGSFANYVLLICGGGELEDDLRDLVLRKGLRGKVIITGKFGDDEKVKFYSAFDYFVFPTLAEGFGLVLLEAMFFGLPVLCSDLQVLKEVGGNFPLYFKTGDANDLSLKLSQLVGNNKFNVEGQVNYVNKHFSLARFGENYESLYQSLLKAL